MKHAAWPRAGQLVRRAGQGSGSCPQHRHTTLRTARSGEGELAADKRRRPMTHPPPYVGEAEAPAVGPHISLSARSGVLRSQDSLLGSASCGAGAEALGDASRNPHAGGVQEEGVAQGRHCLESRRRFRVGMTSLDIERGSRAPVAAAAKRGEPQGADTQARTHSHTHIRPMPGRTGRAVSSTARAQSRRTNSILGCLIPQDPVR